MDKRTEWGMGAGWQSSGGRTGRVQMGSCESPDWAVEVRFGTRREIAFKTRGKAVYVTWS